MFVEEPKVIRGHALYWGKSIAQAQCLSCGDVITKDAIAATRNGLDPDAIRVCPKLARGVTAG